MHKMFHKIRNNSEKDHHILNANISNLTNELTELFVDGHSGNRIHFCAERDRNPLMCVASTIEKQTDLYTNFGAQESNCFKGFGSTKNLDNSSVSKNALQVPDAEHFPFFDIKKCKPNNADFKRRSSLNDTHNYLGIHFGGTCADIAHRQIARCAELQDQSFHPTKRAQLFGDPNTGNETLKMPYSQVFGSKAFSQDITEVPVFGRRASAADVQHVVDHFGFTQNYNAQAAYTKRRSSAADAESLSESSVTRPASLLNAASSDDITRYWHVGTECNATGERKKRSGLKSALKIESNKDKVLIGTSLEGQETNDVHRLFDLMRKLHHYLNEVVPFEAEPIISADCSTHYVKPLIMPCTKNIRTHVRHIVYKCNVFCQEKSRQLDEYHCADREKYFECSRRIYVLRKLTKQLETFKTGDFEHRRSVFVNSFAAARAKNLELLLTQMIDKIRECSAYVEVYHRSIQKNILETGLTSLETLQKAVAIAGAMRIETEDIAVNRKVGNVNSCEDEQDAWQGATAIYEASNHVKEIKNYGDGEQLGGTRGAMRFVGTVD